MKREKYLEIIKRGKKINTQKISIKKWDFVYFANLDCNYSKVNNIFKINLVLFINVNNTTNFMAKKFKLKNSKQTKLEKEEEYIILQ